MIDLHCHILWGVDDGAATLEESVQMCRASSTDGIRAMVATPHAHDDLHVTHPLQFLHQRVDELNSQLQGRPRVALGCELRLNHDLVKQVCDDRTAPTLAGGPYLLVEFPHYVVPVGSQRVLFELMTQQITPIIAHPERNRTLMAEPERFFELVEMGVLGQVDAGSLTGQFGNKVQKTARLMIENGLIHFVASDCHNMRNRLPGLTGAVSEISAMIGEEAGHAISAANPLAVLEGIRVPWRPAPVPPSRKRKWRIFSK